MTETTAVHQSVTGTTTPTSCITDSVDWWSDLDRCREQHPRPHLMRPDWLCLNGQWEFRDDPHDVGRGDHWYASGAAGFDRNIEVPFPPESPMSGLGLTGYHTVMWYRRAFDVATWPGVGRKQRVLAHFDAVDYAADVWVDSVHVGHHRGGHCGFAFDITDALAATGGPHTLVIRAVDNPTDPFQPRGKQDWRPQPHSIWYERTSGIWRDVWLELVGSTWIDHIEWRIAEDLAHIRGVVELAGRLPVVGAADIELIHGGAVLASQTIQLTGTSRVEFTCIIDAQLNEQAAHDLAWSPARPTLIDARLRLIPAADTAPVDEVFAYLGLRHVATDTRTCRLNGRAFYIRAVLSQGYWSESHLASPDPDAARREVELIKSLGFNTVRLHQKTEDHRFLYWCDRIGLATWVEMPSAYAFDTMAVRRLTDEWCDIVGDYAPHPSVITWVPFNESWGIGRVATDRAQQAVCRGLAELTRAIDPTRLVVSNDGWEHVASDLWTIHDYEPDPAVLARRYGDHESVDRLIAGVVPTGKPTCARSSGGSPTQSLAAGLVAAQAEATAPVLLTEFFGVALRADRAERDWGYADAADAADYEERLLAALAAVHASPVLAGFCLTQLTDTGGEINGLCDQHRHPKLPIDVICAAVVGNHADR